MPTRKNNISAPEKKKHKIKTQGAHVFAIRSVDPANNISAVKVISWSLLLPTRVLVTSDMLISVIVVARC